MKQIQFTGNDGTFCLEQPEDTSYLYFPIANERGLKDSVTPALGGDSKLSQNAFLLEPVSVENLHNNRSTRNFWCQIEGKGNWSVTGASAQAEWQRATGNPEETVLQAEFMHQKVTRKSREYGLEAEVDTFVALGHNVEIMQVKIRNLTEEICRFTPVAAIPIYGRSADNIRDHRHVTSLLHRITTGKYGVRVKPTLSFDERGHQENHMIYYVYGVNGEGTAPESFFPTVESFIGEGGSFTAPRAVLENRQGVPIGTKADGKEAMGGLKFAPVSLAKGEEVVYLIFLGAAEKEDEIDEVIHTYGTEVLAEKAEKEVRDYWQKKVNVSYHTGNTDFDNFMKWVSFQPFLRKIYGCSFLPHHDYGRGGRGWRDLWQDCLSLLIMDPAGVRKMIVDNYGGVRIDGTNATIIGERQGEFIADRNGIARVWMDHGVWPFMTTKLYLKQTGDLNVLLEETTYFADGQKRRGTVLAKEKISDEVPVFLDAEGRIYKGTVLEHILLQNLCAYFETGEHNEIRLRGADWNDAIDMASENGESVAFTCAYLGNLSDLGELLEVLALRKICTEVSLAREIQILTDVDEKRLNEKEYRAEILAHYLDQCMDHVSGEKVQIPVLTLAHRLKSMAEAGKEQIRKKEWISREENKDTEGWYNSYYDNHKRTVEGYFETGVRMMLTGQVFAIMSGTALTHQVGRICRAADHYLYQREIGGYRLNTDFGEVKLDMGRMFGFAYGEKENGAVFSHMAVMYANSLYQRGFAREGYKALQTLADTALDFETGRIYPGIPEYFNGQGRGMYHYLTGAASWYMLTMVTEVFGVRGRWGDLELCPKLMREQFDGEGRAVITLPFAGKIFEICYENRNHLDYENYTVKNMICDEALKKEIKADHIGISRKSINGLKEKFHRITVILG